MMYEKIKLNEPIKMFEAFSGIGTQAMALKRLGVEYEIVGYSEIDPYAIKSYKAIHGDAIKNYGDITKMVEIPECDIFTWSFPCQDLSIAGSKKGMSKDTRSGLVYDVLRLVRDTKIKPKVLIMENVTALIQENFVRQFGEIQLELESYGYTNYVETLNSKHYGIPQNRDRVFMVSILGEYSYNFPDPKKLEIKLLDVLETNVDQEYYLTKDQREKIESWNAFQKPLENIKDPSKDLSPTLTARGAGENHSGMILVKDPLKAKRELCEKIIDNGFVEQGDMIRHSFINDRNNNLSRKENENNISATLTTRPDTLGVVVQEQEKLEIRKLTPLECWRLMGIDDQDYYKAEKVSSRSQLYKQAGNAIVVDVFQEILRGLL